MNYKTYEPDPSLASLIKCYWTLESDVDDAPLVQTIVPDGCMEIIFHYGDLYEQFLDGSTTIVQPRSFMMGQLTRPLKIRPTGVTGIFSVRFCHEGFMPFKSFPIKRMENTATPLTELFGSVGAQLEEDVLAAASTNERIQIVEAFLNGQFNHSQIDEVVKYTVQTILSCKGSISVQDLALHNGLSRRQLERKFVAAIGLSPKQLSRTVRLQATLRMLLKKRFTSLAALAYDNQFYDQAHFIKDFKDLTGSTPKEFYGDNIMMSSLFYGGE